MINLIGPLDPTTAYPQALDTKIGNALGAIVFHNLSPYEIAVQLGNNGETNVLVGAWGWRRLDVDYPTPRINWMIVATPAQSNPPLSIVFLETCDNRQEVTPQYFGTYTRQTSIGSQVATASTGANIVDGQPLGTTVTEATPVGEASSFVLIKNDGTLLIASLDNGAVVNLINITPGGATSAPAIVIGEASKPSITTLYGQVVGTSTFAASAVQNGNLNSGVSDFNGEPLRGFTHFGGTGSGTYGHNYHVTPNYVGVTSTETGSTETVGIDSITSSSVHVNMPNFWPFTAIAVAT